MQPVVITEARKACVNLGIQSGWAWITHQDSSLPRLLRRIAYRNDRRASSP